MSRLRRLRFGLSTLLGRTPRGFFIPYRYAADIPDAAVRRGYPALEPLFAAAEDRFAALLAAMDRHAGALAALSGTTPPEPRWEQDWFPRLDAAALYALIRETRPARIVEVGSGHSTRFAMRAVRDAGCATAMTAIDPSPRADIAGAGATLNRATLQQAGDAPFAHLAAGDMLFIDSSHILMPGTDVDLLFNTILPRLPAGVLVHIHDILLPDAYPTAWDWRGYNEQSAVAMLVAGGGYELIWSSRYVATRMQARLAGSTVARLPLVTGALETSLWLRKTAAA